MANRTIRAYAPVVMSEAARAMFQQGLKLVVDKFVYSETKRQWRDRWLELSSKEEIQAALAEHVKKGDPRDVIIYCLICLYHGWTTS